MREPFNAAFFETLSLARLGPMRVLFAMATEAEYAPALRTKVAPLITGVGPVEAAGALGAALAWFAAKGETPDLVVALGSAGSATLDHGEIYQATHATYRDMDCTPLGFPARVTPFSIAPHELELGPRIPGVRTATIESGASIVSGEGYGRVSADMVDMETFAFARVAHAFAVACISLRGISDGRAPLTGVSDWTDALEAIGVGLAASIDALEAALCDGRITIR